MEKNLENDSDLLNKHKNFNELGEIEKKQVQSNFNCIFNLINNSTILKIIGDYKLGENVPENEKKIMVNNILKNRIKSNKEDFKNLKCNPYMHHVFQIK